MADEDDDNEKDIHARFFRERRLLMGISVVLLAHQFLGITVSKGQDTVGLHFDIEDPAKIWWVVWAVWLWTAICVLQQFNSLQPRSKYPADRDHATRQWISDRIATRKVRGPALKHLKATVSKKQKPRFSVKWAGRIERDGPARERFVSGNVEVSCRWDCDDVTVATTKAAEFDKAMAADGLDCPGGSVGGEGGECYFSRIIPVRMVPIEDRVLIRRVSTLWTLLSTSFSTDYLAPLLIGFAPILVAALQGVLRRW
jgi:hypothetical protein